MKSPQIEVAKLKLSLNEISNLIKSETQDVSGGSFADGSLRVRTIGEKRLVETFKKLELKNSSSGARILLGDIAGIKSSIKKRSILKFIDGKPAVEIWARRSKTRDALRYLKMSMKLLLIHKT